MSFNQLQLTLFSVIVTFVTSVFLIVMGSIALSSLFQNGNVSIIELLLKEGFVIFSCVTLMGVLGLIPSLKVIRRWNLIEEVCLSGDETSSLSFIRKIPSVLMVGVFFEGVLVFIMGVLFSQSVWDQLGDPILSFFLITFNICIFLAAFFNLFFIWKVGRMVRYFSNNLPKLAITALALLASMVSYWNVTNRYGPDDFEKSGLSQEEQQIGYLLDKGLNEEISGNDTLALVYYRKALKKDSTLNTLYLKGRVLDRLGENDKAINLYDAVIQRLEAKVNMNGFKNAKPSEKNYEMLDSLGLAMNPGKVYFKRGRLLFFKEKFDSAFRDFKKVEKNFSWNNVRFTRQNHLFLGAIYLKNGQPDKALKALDQTYEEEVRWFTHFYRSLAFAQLNMKNDADRAYQKSLAYMPDDVKEMVGNHSKDELIAEGLYLKSVLKDFGDDKIGMISRIFDKIRKFQ